VNEIPEVEHKEVTNREHNLRKSLTWSIYEEHIQMCIETSRLHTAREAAI